MPATGVQKLPPLELAGGGSPPTATAGPSSPVGEASAGWWPRRAGASWPLVSHAVRVLDVWGWSQHAGCSLCCTFVTTQLLRWAFLLSPAKEGLRSPGLQQNCGAESETTPSKGNQGV